MARAPITKQQFETIIKPKLKEYNKALSDKVFAINSQKYIKTLIKNAELVIRNHVCWVVHEVTNHNAGRGRLRAKIVRHRQPGTGAFGNNAYDIQYTEFWDLKIPREKVNKYLMSSLDSASSEFPYWKMFGSVYPPRPPYISGPSYQPEERTVIIPINADSEIYSPASKVGYISLFSRSNYYSRDNDFYWYGEDRNYISLTHNVWMRPIDHFDKNHLNDPVKVKAFKESFKDDEGSPLNKLWKTAQEELDISSNTVTSTGADLQQVLTSLGTGLTLANMPENEDTWAALCQKNNWSVVEGEISIESDSKLFQDIFIKDLTDRVKYFKGHTPAENNFARVMEGSDPVRLTQETILLEENGSTKRTFTIGYKEAGTNPVTGQPLTTMREIVNPTNQQNVEIRADKHTLALLWCMRAYATVRKISIGVMTSGSGAQYSDEAIVNISERFFTGEFSRINREAFWLDNPQDTSESEYADDDPYKLLGHTQISDTGAGRPYNPDDPTHSIPGLKEKLRRGLVHVYLSLLDNVNFDIAGNQPLLPANGTGLNVKRDSKLLQSNTEISTVSLNQYFEELKYIYDQFFGAKTITYEDGTRYDYIVPVDFRVCHSSCHGSCHGSRGRR